MSYWKYYKNMFAQFDLTDAEARYCANKLSNAIKRTHDTCISHIRIAVNEKGKKEYDKIKSDGCCGFYDKEITLKSDKVVKFGFCYGH